MKAELFWVDSRVLLEVTAKEGLSNRDVASMGKVSPTTVGRWLNAARSAPVQSKEETLRKVALSLKMHWRDLVLNPSSDTNNKMHLQSGEWHYEMLGGRIEGVGDLRLKGRSMRYTSPCLSCRGRVVMRYGNHLMGEISITNAQGEKQGFFMARASCDGNTTRAELLLLLLDRNRMVPIPIVATHSNPL